MTNCCEKKSCEMENASAAQAKVLWIVLILNAVMFFVEVSAGLWAGSLSLVGDSMDMLGDALAYGSSLYVIKLGERAKARSAIFKGWIIVFSALVVLGSAIYRTIYSEVPDVHIMGLVGALALGVNAICLLLLTRFKKDDINMESVWLCSRNDIIANVSVLVAAALVYWTKTPWPDLVIGIALSILFLRSAISILRRSASILQK